jgi:hypothetical protein
MARMALAPIRGATTLVELAVQRKIYPNQFRQRPLDWVDSAVEVSATPVAKGDAGPDVGTRGTPRSRNWRWSLIDQRVRGSTSGRSR